MSINTDWELFLVPGSPHLKACKLAPDERTGWSRVLVLMPRGAKFPNDPSKGVCIVDFLSGKAIYELSGRQFFSCPGTSLRIPAGESFEICMTYTDVMWTLSFPPKLRCLE